MRGASRLLFVLGLWSLACAGPGADTRDGIRLERLETTSLTGPTLQLHVIDVGQGDAILLMAPGGKTVLIDTGPAGARKRLLEYLQAHGVTRLDLLIHSHAHADHVGNTAALLKAIEVGAVLDPGFPHPAKAYARALAAMEAEGVPTKLARRGRKIGVGPSVKLMILAPEEPFLRRTRSDVNANSVVLRVDFGEVRILLTGDAEHETEERLLARDPQALQAQVLKVAHHGSRFATRRRFLAAVSPDLALISAGPTNAYGHPDQRTLRRLRRQGVPVAVTARDGHLVVETDGKRIRLRRNAVNRR